MNKKRDFKKQIDTIAESMRESASDIALLNHNRGNNDGSLPDEVKQLAKDKRHLKDNSKSISFITGIEKNRLPPSDELTNKQIKFLCKEITTLLKAHNFLADYPQALSVTQKYNLLRSKWDEKQMYTDYKINHLEFCNREPAICPFHQKFCRCKDFNGFDDYFDDNTIVF